MSNSGISFGGLASGLDTQAIISALLAVEQRPIAQMEQRVSTLKGSKSKFGDLEGMLDKLREKANSLRQTNSFVEYAAALDKEDFLLADASSSAAPGTYRIDVQQLAQNQVTTSTGYADKTSSIGSGTLLFEVDGTIEAVTIDGANTSLEGIASAINSNQNLAVRAQVVDTGNASDPYQLVLTSEGEGADGAFTVSLDGGPVGNGLDGLVASLTDTVAAQDAIVNIDGINYQRSSNTIGNAVQGVTLNLKAPSTTVGAGFPSPDVSTLTISPDTEATATKIQEFVDAYNEIVDFVQETNVVSEEGEASSPLFGDATLRSIRSQLRQIVGNSVDTGNTAYSLFAQIGVESDRDGRLTFNRSEFDEALAEDADAVRNLFSDSSTGIAQRIYDQIDIYTDSVDGLLKIRKDGFDSLIKQTEDRIENAERRLEAYELQLTNRFASLESLLSGLQTQSASLNFGG